MYVADKKTQKTNKLIPTGSIRHRFRYMTEKTKDWKTSNNKASQQGPLPPQ